MSVLSNIVKGLVMSAAPEVDAIALRGANKERATAFSEQKEQLSDDFDLGQVQRNNSHDGRMRMTATKIHEVTRAEGINESDVDFTQLKFTPTSSSAYTFQGLNGEDVKVSGRYDADQMSSRKFDKKNKEKNMIFELDNKPVLCPDVDCKDLQHEAGNCPMMQTVKKALEKMYFFDDDLTPSAAKFQWVAKDIIEISEAPHVSEKVYVKVATKMASTNLSDICKDCADGCCNKE